MDTRTEIHVRLVGVGSLLEPEASRMIERGCDGVFHGSYGMVLSVSHFDVAGILAGPLNDAVWVGQMSAVPELQVHVIH